MKILISQFFKYHKYQVLICGNFPHVSSHLIVPGEQWLSNMHFDEDATKTPHVDREVIRDAEKDLG